MSEKRTFIAVPLPQEVKEQLARVQTLLAPLSDGIKWTDPENLHITLKFLGETPEWILDDAINEFKRICENKASFNLQLDVLGQFPKEGDPRILWAGLKKMPPIIYALSDEFNAGFMSMGFDDSGKKFAPHITLARVKHKFDDEFIPAYYDVQLDPIVFKVDKIVLFESTHRGGALKYVPLEEYPLK